MASEPRDQRPYCFACRHFYITHEPATPYGCRALGFKSAHNPALVVLSNSGLQCQLFTLKEKP
ncbi:MAG: uracil-DNA glycosylase [Desulfurivibrio sp.]